MPVWTLSFCSEGLDVLIWVGFVWLFYPFEMGSPCVALADQPLTVVIKCWLWICGTLPVSTSLILNYKCSAIATPGLLVILKCVWWVHRQDSGSTPSQSAGRGGREPWAQWLLGMLLKSRYRTPCLHPDLLQLLFAVLRLGDSCQETGFSEGSGSCWESRSVFHLELSLGR